MGGKQSKEKKKGKNLVSKMLYNRSIVEGGREGGRGHELSI